MSVFSTIGIFVKNKSPEICLAAGIAGVIGGTISACRATIKAESIVKDARAKLDDVELAKECAVNTNQTYTDEDVRKDKAAIFASTAVQLAKAYGPAVILTAAGITAIVTGHHILNKRNAALMAAYAAVDKAYKDYAKRVEKKLGGEVAKELKAGVEEHEITVEKKGKNGKIEKKKTVRKCVTPDSISPYAKFFDEGCTGWDKSPEYNLTYLKNVQNQMNDLLRIRKFVTLNDVYDALGIPRTSAGQEVGWVMGGDGDNYIDFGIFKTDYVPNRDFINGYEPVILLDFNVDGVIRDKIDEINNVKAIEKEED